MSDKAPVVVDGRLLHAGRTGIGRITKLMIETAAESRQVYVIGAPGEIAFKNVIYLATTCEQFGLMFLLQNFLLNFLAFKRAKIIFPHYFSAMCFIRKFVFVHDIMAITEHKKFYAKFSFVKKYILEKVVRLGLMNADVACPSSFSCGAVKEVFGVRSECLPNGTHLKAAAADQALTAEDPVVLGRRLSVGYVGNKRPHKNIPGLQKFCATNGYDLLFFDEFMPESDHDDELLSRFIRHVDAMALFSHCEGFGIPIIEGALFGKYLFCSDIPPFRELSEVGINFVGPDTVVGELVASDPAVVERRYRFQKMTSFIRDYVT